MLRNLVIFLALFTFIMQLSHGVYAQSSVSIPNPTDQPPTTNDQLPIVIDPILQYLEGYAYDGAGKIIANAKVMVKLEMSKATFYETRADANGLFSVNPEYLPIFPYYLEFVDPLSSGQANKMTTSEFVKKNKDYLTKNNINLETATKGGTPVSTPSAGRAIDSGSFGGSKLGGTSQPLDSFDNTQDKSARGQQANKQTSKQANQELLTIVALLILILALGAGAAYLFMKMKRNSVV